MRSESAAVQHVGWRTTTKSLLLAGTAIAAFELLRRLRERMQTARAAGQFVSEEWLANHVSSHGDGYAG